MSKRAVAVAVAGYLGLIVNLTLFQFPQPQVEANLVPFASIANDFHLGGRALVVNFVGNLGVFVPFGFLLPFLGAGYRSAWRIGLSGFALSVLIEALQYQSGHRTADVDDVLLNTLGGLLGYAGHLLLVGDAARHRLVPAAARR